MAIGQVVAEKNQGISNQDPLISGVGRNTLCKVGLNRLGGDPSTEIVWQLIYHTVTSEG